LVEALREESLVHGRHRGNNRPVPLSALAAT
jgi:hypothetical protein